MRRHLFLDFWLVVTWFFADWRNHRAVTHLEDVRQSNVRRGKKLGFQLSHKHPLKEEFEMERKRSFKKMLNNRGPNIERCGTPLVLSYSLNVLFTFTLCFLFAKYLFMYLRAICFQTHMLLTWQSINHGLMCPPLSKTFFHISNIQLRQCCGYCCYDFF